ncbi:hypothetical protein HYALB_00003344 [Hymenoscyphus albidus]|uniref:Uncharacterized protein n=1 Tax=Hymenoscyphus albidus TaxID=595503 RepID=A0A9N9LMT2_9HELO|nr:hypothetical protein HYALB_00003344 [Hymenoscyphus albidus]
MNQRCNWKRETLPSPRHPSFYLVYLNPPFPPPPLNNSSQTTTTTITTTTTTSTIPIDAAALNQATLAGSEGESAHAVPLRNRSSNLPAPTWALTRNRLSAQGCLEVASPGRHHPTPLITSSTRDS